MCGDFRDSLSGFSNQDDGVVIIFGIDEENDYAESGVYDVQDLQKKINAQCLQMEPVVRPLFTVLEKDGKHFVAAEIPGIDLAGRPCYYRGQGRIKGTRKEICDYLGLSSVTYAIQRYIMPLVAEGLIHLSIPEKPGSQKQLYYSKE